MASGLAEGGDQLGRIGRAHERFADERGVRAAAVGAGGVGGGVDAAFADGDDVLGELWDEALAQGEIGLEDGEVAVVDADQGGILREGAAELGLVVNLEKRVEAGGAGTFEFLYEHGRFYFEQPDNRLWCGVFSAVSDAPLQLQAEEVLQARFVPIEAALADAAVQPYCPDSLVALKRYLALNKQAR